MRRRASAPSRTSPKSFPGKWKVIYFYPKDFTFVCPTEIVGFAKLAADFADSDAVLLAGSTDNEFVKLAWRRDHKDLDRLNHWMFADTTGALVDMLGIREAKEGVALRATFIVDPITSQHVSVNNQRRPQLGRSAARAGRLCRPTSCALQPRGRTGDLNAGTRDDGP
jgi:peroxiredoxin (alkyl hydroperoxide reductase subunit C)